MSADPTRASTPDWTLTPHQAGLTELLDDGALAPLDGFLTAQGLARLRERATLDDGTPWRGEVVLDVPHSTAEAAHAHGSLRLRDEDGTVLAELEVEPVGPRDVTGEPAGPRGAAHEPAVRPRAAQDRDSAEPDEPRELVGGALRALSRRPPLAFAELHRTRTEIRELLAEARRVTAVQPTHVPDVATLERWRHHLDERDATLLVQPRIADLPDEAWAATVRAHQRAVEQLQLPASRWILQLLPLPRDEDVHDAATLRAIIAANHGADHLLDAGGADAAVASAFGLELGAIPVTPTGPWHPAVREELDHLPGTEQRGIVVLLTGLSGSGKSTIARALRARILERGHRSVTLLDGDLVRRTLSSGLGFSPADRETNVRRIGWVAAEVSRHGGVAICAPIAPHDHVRRAVRHDVEAAGGRFVLVHVSTPLEVCEQRDVKGLYAGARSGELTGMTGIDDPYEEPTDAALTLDTSQVDLEAAVDRIVEVLGRKR